MLLLNWIIANSMVTFFTNSEEPHQLRVVKANHTKHKSTRKRAKINKEHKRKWPDNACCTIANKASTARQEIWRQWIEGSLLIEICLQFMFSLNSSSHTHTRRSYTRDSLNLFWLIDSIHGPSFSLKRCCTSVHHAVEKEGFRRCAKRHRVHYLQRSAAPRKMCAIGMMMWSRKCRKGQVNCDRFSTICKYMHKQ